MQGNLEASGLDALSSALDLARVGLARWDAEDRLVVFNDTYRTLVYPNLKDEVRLGRKFVELAQAFYGVPANLPPGRTTEDMVAERLKRHAALSTSFEYRSNKRSFRVAERRTADGGAVGLYIDVTEERRNELMARENERRLRLLFDNMRNIAYCLGTQSETGLGYDQDGVKVYGRDAAQMFGNISREGYADVDLWYNAVHPEDRDRYLAAERERRTRGGTYDLEYRFIHPVTQELRWAREVGWTSEDRENQRRSLESYVLDITESKEREAELARAQARMRAALDETYHANLAKSRFLAHMSHELRTPLNAIIGFAQLVAEEHVGPDVSPPYRGYAEAILSGGQHLLTLINDILDLSKIEAGKMELAESEFALSEAVGEATAMLQGQFAAKSQHLDVAVDGVMLRADRQKLRQILLNLLGNAHKFVPPGGHVAVRATRGADGGIALDIADDGPGMDEEEIEIAWAPFSRSATSLTAPEGTGLGLPISRSFAELHGGTLEIESRKGHGTTLRLRLPAVRVLGTEAP
ncbi:MAG TPA: ATP-binding protein [Dongiaceae bacterium]|nr:ATP-binding protein [Dongiaceae bacterium]